MKLPVLVVCMNFLAQHRVEDLSLWDLLSFLRFAGISWPSALPSVETARSGQVSSPGPHSPACCSQTWGRMRILRLNRWARHFGCYSTYVYPWLKKWQGTWTFNQFLCLYFHLLYFIHVTCGQVAQIWQIWRMVITSHPSLQEACIEKESADALFLRCSTLALFFLLQLLNNYWVKP